MTLEEEEKGRDREGKNEDQDRGNREKWLRRNGGREGGQKERRKRGGEIACYLMFSNKIIQMNQIQTQLESMVLSREYNKTVLQLHE